MRLPSLSDGGVRSYVHYTYVPRYGGITQLFCQKGGSPHHRAIHPRGNERLGGEAEVEGRGEEMEGRGRGGGESGRWRGEGENGAREEVKERRVKMDRNDERNGRSRGGGKRVKGHPTLYSSVISLLFTIQYGL